MEIKSKTKVMFCLLTMIASMFIAIPLVQSEDEVTYGPRLDTLYGHFIESPSAQYPMLTSAEVDVWPDIRDPLIIRALEDAHYEVALTPEAFLYYHIDVNVRNQVGFNGTHIACEGGTYMTIWRNSNESGYFTYQGLPYKGYVPLDDINFRHALAHCIPKDEIVATVYGGISGAPIDSLIPEAQRAWYTPGVDGHPLALGDPTATTVYNPATGANHDACSILRYGGYVWEPTAPNPAPKHSTSDPDGNWLDFHLGADTDDPNTVWDDTERMPMNYIEFAGVTQAIAPDSYGRDDMCYRDWRSIGLSIDHPEVDYGYLTDTMMDYYQYDMYALGWSIGRFPDHLESFFHSRNNLCPEGYNMPGVNNTELDGYCDIILHSKDVNEVKQATADASELLAELCVSIPTITRPLCTAAGKAGAPSFTDSVKGIVNSPGFGTDTDLTFYGLHWESMETTENPLGIGGSMDYIVPSEPTNWHPAFASTTDEFLVMQHVFGGLINVDPYTHVDVPWEATDWLVEDWDFGGSDMGMNTTFWLRDDLYYHDGVQFDAYTAEFGLEWLQEMKIGRAQAMWQNLVDVEVHDQFCFSVLHNVTSLWIFYDIAGWASLIPPHIYDGTDIHFRPEAEANELNPKITKLVGLGAYVITDMAFELGGWVELTAYRENPDLGITTHWFWSAEGYDAWLTECFHWIGDGNSDGVIDIKDLTKAGKSYALTSSHPNYDAEADTNPEDEYHVNDGRVDMKDIFELSKYWGKQRDYS
jgi:ABC-type transport system substrate-binding protein